MNLADRLAARRATDESSDHSHDASVHTDDGPVGDPLQDFWAPPTPTLSAVPSLTNSPAPAAAPVTKAARRTSREPAIGAASRSRARFVDPFAPIKRNVHAAILDTLGPTLYDARMDDEELATRVRQTLQTVIEAEDALLSTADRNRITNEVADEILGYGPLEPFLRDKDITEIMVNGADQIYVERAGRIHPVAAAFTDEQHLRRTIDKIVGAIGRRVDEASPMVDARLPDGSRVNAVISPVALDGAMLTIRKFATEPFTIQDLIGFGTVTAPVANLLSACVRGRMNILISGGTGSGKTTTLNVVSSFVPEDERIVTIEDAAELQLHQEHVVRMESRPSNIEGRGEITARDLVRNALRMRPDRIIVGEVRDGAALDMLQAMNTGHDGSLTTLHANSPRDALSRLETMVLMAGVDLPSRAIREQAASALDLIVHQSRLRDGTRRITHITEVTGMESDVITLQDLFTFDYHAGVDEHGSFRGTLISTGIRPMFLQRLADQGIPAPADLFADRR
ncbi:MAG: pilus assembly protein CpaF [Pseudonocardiales bacterium]|nr:MAG: pilus assembly protein CpaF [Pseudonocardiales bacterium]